jgi:hypothetical protein
MSFPTFIWFFSKVISVLLVLCTVVLLPTKLSRHKLLLGRIRLGSVHKLRYSFLDTFISVSSIHIALHIPRPSNPRLATFIAYDYDYKDAECRTSIAEVRTTLWFFPVLFRVTRGPWFSVQLHDFRLRVHSSQRPPGWVQKLRRNLTTTVLTGELLRLDSFKTTVLLSGLTGAPNGSTSPIEKPGVDDREPQDEIRVTGYGKGYQTRNWQQRTYTFDNVEAQLRRSWVENAGSFVLIAEGTRWTKEPSALQLQTVSFWW